MWYIFIKVEYIKMSERKRFTISTIFTWNDHESEKYIIGIVNFVYVDQKSY